MEDDVCFLFPSYCLLLMSCITFRCQAAVAFEYELFSIMVHSGGASGGHYYAYIK